MPEQYVWVTGAGSGIGRAVAEAFLAAGIPVVGTGRQIKPLQELAAGAGITAPFRYAAVDVTSLPQLRAFYSEFTSTANISALINNAGTSNFKPALLDSFEDISKVISTNLTGALFASRLVLPAMAEAKQGTIINIMSVAAKKVLTNSSVYSASKAGLQAYMDVLREEVRQYNIRVINVHPGATETPIWPEGARKKHGHRMMHPADVAKAVLHIYQDASTVIHEEVILRPILGDLA